MFVYNESSNNKNINQNSIINVFIMGECILLRMEGLL
jgi:hypothetical protein